MTSTNDEPGQETNSNTSEQRKMTLRAILANAAPETWYPFAQKIRSAWEPVDLCDLRGSDLSNREIGEVTMAECALDDADFSNSLLNETWLGASAASRAKFIDARLHRTQMIPFYGEAVDFTRAEFDKVAMEYSKLIGSIFVSATLKDVSLSHADLSRSSFVGALFAASRFDGAVLRDTDLSQTTFSACDLRMTLFQYALMKGALLEGCEMMGTDFRGANLDRAVIRGGQFGIYHQGSALTPVRFDDTPEARKLVAQSGAEGVESIEWSAVGSILEALPKRLTAGEPCTRDGFWFTPAQAGSRRHFKSGDVMPEVGGDYGATIWQWDQNQDPPKL